jgi:hypothetical protein
VTDALDTLPLFAAARARRDVALAQVEAHGPRWSEIAYSAIEEIARKQPQVHIDDVLAAGVSQPHHPNAWGAVWMKAIRAEIIQRSNQTRPCTRDPKKHAHQYPVYFSRIYRS